ncbi:MAG: hypothetical protein ACFB03_04085 [Paracoccaceae bacterium]
MILLLDVQEAPSRLEPFRLPHPCYWKKGPDGWRLSELEPRIGIDHPSIAEDVDVLMMKTKKMIVLMAMQEFRF